MTSDTASERRLTRQEIEVARDKAKARIAELAEETYGDDSQLTLGQKHTKKSYNYKVGFITKRFLTKNREAQDFSLTDFFEHIRQMTSDTVVVEGEALIVPAGDHREYLAAASHLLNALELGQQFVEYQRSLLKKREPHRPYDRYQ